MNIDFNRTKKHWRRFQRNRASVFGLSLVVTLLVVSTLAPVITPYPSHSDAFVDVDRAYEAPSTRHLLGTDAVGRDIFSRLIFAYRTSLLLAAVVLVLAVPIGVVAGLAAGYQRGLTETLILRVTDIFLAIPSLVLAMAILGLFEPSLPMAMVAVAFGWWPWYTRLVYNLTRSIATEGYISAARVSGARPTRIMLSEILPNCSGPILTKMTLDAGFVILLGSSLSFLGLGAQPPTPDLGTMVAQGAPLLPDVWWPTVSSSLAIVIAVLGFNLLGEGIRDLFGVDV